MLLTVELLDQDARKGLQRISKAMADKSWLLEPLGVEGLQSARNRLLAGGPAPDGTAWEALKPLTLKLRKNPDKPILNDSGQMWKDLASEVVGSDAVAVGSRMIYARIHQKGGTIRPKNGKALATPAGPRRSVRIPARPFLGFSADERDRVQRKVLLWLKNQVVD